MAITPQGYTRRLRETNTPVGVARDQRGGDRAARCVDQRLQPRGYDLAPQGEGRRFLSSVRKVKRSPR